MSYFFNNGMNILPDKDMFLQKYGCIKIEYREHENKRYYIYAFDNDLPEWDFDSGELVLITRDEKFVNKLKEYIFSIVVGEVFCKECFRRKDINSLSDDENMQFWGMMFWNKTPLRTKSLLQDEILYSFPDIDWSMVQYLTDSERPMIFHEYCANHCMTREEYNNHNKIQQREKEIHHMWKKLITSEILQGTEELLEDYLCEHIEVIEEGMKFLSRQDRIDYGVIDILAKDKNDTRCVIELKINEPDKNILWQSAYYPSYSKDEKIRMITIAPSYPPKIYNALLNVKDVEMKVFFKNANGLFEIKDFNTQSKITLQKQNNHINKVISMS
ncbi:DUF91 domain-containing protein [Bacillus anthracis]|uniref:endonuclease NucS domain-containing protein n=1 Tax=Bacillus anthracis TaxID=1392 RepID=UPI0028495287|nr:endonuclease NucS domain-containing protein [Bacillus anthracis]MDR4408203.1 DUF91 domain-containing protein [Bacillus anthracis]